MFISLFFGIWLGATFLVGGNPLAGLAEALETCVRVFQDAGNTKVIAFSAMVGALIAFTQRSGGVDGFIQWISKRNLVNSTRRAGLMAWLIGVLVFVESSITCLVTGAVSRPIFDKLKISREKLAYICDSTSAPVCILIPINGWGAFIMGLLAAQKIDAPLIALFKSLPFNLYAIFAIIMVLTIIITEKDFGPMRKAERRARAEGKLHRDDAEPLVADEVTALEAKPGVPPRARNMILPIAVMVLMMPVSLLITGKGNIMQGSGSTSVFWSVLASITFAGLFYGTQHIFTLKESVDLFFKGLGGLMPLALLMMLAFAIGDICKALGTGPYVANVAKANVPLHFIPLILFVISGFIAFSTGTSWGTFAIMIPIGLPLVGIMGVHMPLTIGAILSGGIFGDHCSPISDTTIISSMASACDHIDHVQTQLPYALVVAAIAALCYGVLGFVFA